MNRPMVSVFLGISLDGFIAGEGGDLSWLSTVQTNPPEDTGFESLMSEIDVMVLGRNTYDAVLQFEAWPFRGKHVVVLTHRTLRPLHGEEGYTGALTDLLIALKQADYRHVYLDGGVVAREGLAAGVVDELTLSWVPMILGNGIPLFTPGLSSAKWRLKESRAFPSGLLQAKYVPAAALQRAPE